MERENDIMSKDELKIVSVVNFVRGGKSSISRLLAEKLNTTIMNFDPKRDSEFYNAVKTKNIPENSTIKRIENGLEIENEDEIITIKSNSNYFICDFGGRFDERINEFESDCYVIPMMDDYESISESIRATKYILEANPKAKIIHVLNMVMCQGKDEKEDFRKGYKQNLEENQLDKIPALEMPRSKLLKRIINDGVTENEIINDTNTLIGKKSFRVIHEFTDKLINEIKKEIGASREK